MSQTLNLKLKVTGQPLPTADLTTRSEWANALTDTIASMFSGNQPDGAFCTVEDGATTALEVGTFSDHATANDTVTIGGTVFTGKSSTTANNEFNVGTTAAATAANLAAAINASTTAAFKGMVVATSAAGVITIRCAGTGTFGNQVTITKSCSVLTLTTASGFLAGGAGNTPVAFVF